MTEERVPRKWEFIASELEKIDAPKKVVNAAIEMDRALDKLGLGSNTEFWEDSYNPEVGGTELFDLIQSTDSCTACFFAYPHCETCLLGIPGNCTPRSRYADQYFSIVLLWAKENLDI